jgi:hypothetical protein
LAHGVSSRTGGIAEDGREEQLLAFSSQSASQRTLFQTDRPAPNGAILIHNLDIAADDGAV